MNATHLFYLLILIIAILFAKLIYRVAKWDFNFWKFDYPHPLYYALCLIIPIGLLLYLVYSNKIEDYRLNFNDIFLYIYISSYPLIAMGFSLLIQAIEQIWIKGTLKFKNLVLGIIFLFFGMIIFLSPEILDKLR
jgi:hypothetical protein